VATNQQQIISAAIRRIGPERFAEELFPADFDCQFPIEPLGLARVALNGGQLRTALSYAWRALIWLVDSGTIRATNDTRSGPQAELALQFSDYLIYIKRHDVAPNESEGGHPHLCPQAHVAVV